MPGSTASTFPPSPEDLGGTGLTVVGHAHADLDSIASACVVARWLGGVAGRARVGDPYTDAIWKSLGGEQLPIVLGAERVFLVDCQESAIEAGRVLGAIDHHAPFATESEGLVAARLLPNLINMDRLVGMGEDARILGVSVTTLRRWEATGRLVRGRPKSGRRPRNGQPLSCLDEVHDDWRDSLGG